MSTFREVCERHLEEIGAAMVAWPRWLISARRESRQRHREQPIVKRTATRTADGCLGCLFIGPVAVLVGGSLELALSITLGLLGEMVLVAWALVVVLAWSVAKIVDTLRRSRPPG